MRPARGRLNWFDAISYIDYLVGPVKELSRKSFIVKFPSMAVELNAIQWLSWQFLDTPIETNCQGSHWLFPSVISWSYVEALCFCFWAVLWKLNAGKSIILSINQASSQVWRSEGHWLSSMSSLSHETWEGLVLAVGHILYILKCRLLKLHYKFSLPAWNFHL